MQETFVSRKTTIFLLITAVFFGLLIGVGLDFELEESPVEEVDQASGRQVEFYEPLVSHEETIIETVDEAVEAVVSIELEDSISGSGFFISSDGYILTNRHVVQEDGNYEVITHDGSTHQAELVSRDSVRDLAFLKVEGEGFKTLELADSDGLRLGQTTIAIGYTLGELKNSVSVGVVSGLVRDIWARDGWSLERLEGMIQTDAAINMGNSGGPLLNLRGQVIGINTAKDIGAENVGFAIPVNQAKSAINSVLEHGRIITPFIGVRYLMVDDREKEMRGLPINYGALIVRGGPNRPAVDPDSPANRADLREGDIITALDGNRIDSNNPLYESILEYMPGDTVEVEYIRGEVTETVELELAERDSD